jgi:hypothetical protein
MIAQLVIFVHWRLQLQLVVPDLCVKPCLASFVPVYIRNPNQILHIISNIQKNSQPETYQRNGRKGFAHHILF